MYFRIHYRSIKLAATTNFPESVRLLPVAASDTVPKDGLLQSVSGLAN